MNAAHVCAAMLHGIRTQGSKRSLGSQAIQPRREGRWGVELAIRNAAETEENDWREGQSAPECSLLRTDTRARVEMRDHNLW
jgi:hypothetical protein